MLRKAEWILAQIKSLKPGVKYLILGVAVFCCCLGLLVAAFSWAESNPYSPNKVIRLHVIANSDSLADQALKYQVRDAIVREMTPVYSRARTVEEARVITEKSLPKLQKTAEKVIAQAGSSYPVRVMHGHYNFPVKSYRTLTLPAGDYEAVRVVIGTGAGKNWWCVLFPPLCFVDLRQVIQAPPRMEEQKTGVQSPTVADTVPGAGPSTKTGNTTTAGAGNSAKTKSAAAAQGSRWQIKFKILEFTAKLFGRA